MTAAGNQQNEVHHETQKRLGNVRKLRVKHQAICPYSYNVI